MLRPLQVTVLRELHAALVLATEVGLLDEMAGVWLTPASINEFCDGVRGLADECAGLAAGGKQTQENPCESG